MSLVQEAQAGLTKANSSNNSNNDENAAAAPPTAVQPVRNGGRTHSGVDPGLVFSDSGPGPSPSPPPRPTPAPAQVSIQSRQKAVPGLGSRGGYAGSPSSAPVAEAERGDTGIPTAGAAGRAVDVDVDANVDANVNVDGGGSNEVEMKDAVGRLVEWRDELLATGMYTPHNPIVTELNRRIALAAGRRGSRALQREE